jgi:hypothetical protein
MRGLFLIREHENVGLELTDEVFVHRTHAELRVAIAQMIGGLGLTFGLLCVVFGKFTQKAKGLQPARMGFGFQPDEQHQFRQFVIYADNPHVHTPRKAEE